MEDRGDCAVITCKQPQIQPVRATDRWLFDYSLPAARDIPVIIDSHMQMGQHVSAVCRVA